jgi:hypothetical protein
MVVPLGAATLLHLIKISELLTPDADTPVGADGAGAAKLTQGMKIAVAIVISFFIECAPEKRVSERGEFRSPTS